LPEGVNVVLHRYGREPNAMPNQKQRIEDLERERDRLKNELLSANEQVAQLKILNENYVLQIRQLKEKKNPPRC
jgi:hypothetical protein